MPRVRIAGIYTENDRILLVKHAKNGKEYYLLPGGGQENGESAPQALIREWREELDLSIEAGKFLFYGESLPPNSKPKQQVLQIVFEVKSIDREIKVSFDGAIIGYDWIPIKDLRNISFFPACLDQLISYLEQKNYPLYSTYNWLT